MRKVPDTPVGGADTDLAGSGTGPGTDRSASPSTRHPFILPPSLHTPATPSYSRHPASFMPARAAGGGARGRPCTVFPCTLLEPNGARTPLYPALWVIEILRVWVGA